MHKILYEFLGCAEMTEDAEVRPFTPKPATDCCLPAMA